MARERVQGGTWGDQRGILESIPCWTARELVAVSGHENKHRQMRHRDGFTRKASLQNTHAPEHIPTKTENASLSQIIVQKISVINMPASEEIWSFFCLFSLIYIHPSPVSFPFCTHTLFLFKPPSCTKSRMLLSKVPDSTADFFFFFFFSLGGPTGTHMSVCCSISTFFFS